MLVYMVLLKGRMCIHMEEQFHNSMAQIQHCFHMKMGYHLLNNLTFNYQIGTIIHTTIITIRLEWGLEIIPTQIPVHIH